MRHIGHHLQLVITTQKIAIQPEGKDDDYTRCVTLPVYGPHPTNLGPESFLNANGMPLRESELAGRRKREFQFVLTAADQKKACRELGAVLYGPRKRLQDGTIVIGTPDYVSPPVGTGILTIKDFRISGAGCNHSNGCEPEVQSVTFDIEITLPVWR